MIHYHCQMLISSLKEVFPELAHLLGQQFTFLLLYFLIFLSSPTFILNFVPLENYLSFIHLHLYIYTYPASYIFFISCLSCINRVLFYYYFIFSYFYWVENSRFVIFFFQHFKDDILILSSLLKTVEKSDINLIIVLLKTVWFFDGNMFCFPLIWLIFTILWYCFICIYCLGFAEIPVSVGKFSAVLSSNFTCA